MKILLTGGGTGGHIYPALALAEYFSKRGDTVRYIGLEGGLEEKLVPAAGVEFCAIPAAPLQRKISPALLHMLSRNAQGVQKALAAVREFAPDAVLATGGYVSFPAIFAGWLYGRRRAARQRPFLGLLEPNAVGGLTNRLLAPLVNEIWGSFPQSAGRFAARFVTTGVPVRAAFTHPPSRAAAAAEFELDPHRPTILVIGGSQGARSLNTAVAEMLQLPMPPHWQIIQLSGEAGLAAAQAAATAVIEAKRAAIFGYLANPLAAYIAADLVVARSGASTLAELARLGKPAIFVPYPHATANHQEHNARAVVDCGAATLLLDRDCHGAQLLAQLEAALEPAKLHALTTAAQKLAVNDAAALIGARVIQAVTASLPISEGAREQ